MKNDFLKEFVIILHGCEGEANANLLTDFECREPILRLSGHEITYVFNKKSGGNYE